MALVAPLLSARPRLAEDVHGFGAASSLRRVTAGLTAVAPEHQDRALPEMPMERYGHVKLSTSHRKSGLAAANAGRVAGAAQ